MTADTDGLWAITCRFSPVRSTQRADNFRRFRQAISVPLALIEIAFSGHADHNAADADLYIRVTDADALWQKERLLNLVLPHLPAQCRHVAWLDSDIRFLDPEWARQAAAGLSRTPIIQLFSSLRYLSACGDGEGVDLRTVSVAAAIAGGLLPVEALQSVTARVGGAPSPGMAWAARRDLLERHGLFDRCIIGGGDTAIACAAYGVPEVAMRLHHMNDMQRRLYDHWATSFHAEVGGQVGVLPGEIEHFWHGALSSRRAGLRHVDLAQHDFDPNTDLTPGRDGAWRWATDKPALHTLLRDYFRERSRG